MQPQEIEVWYVIPAIRKEICRNLLKRGIKKSKIAEILGITKSAVTQYISSKRGGKIELTSGILRRIDSEVINLLDGGCATYSIQKILNNIRKSSLMCRFHQKLEKIPKKCGVCKKWRSI